MGVSKSRLNSLAGRALGCLENDPRMEGTGQGGGRRGHSEQRRVLYQRPPKAASPRRSPRVRETEIFIFHFSFCFLLGEGGGRLLACTSSWPHPLLCSAGVGPSPHTRKGAGASVWPWAGGSASLCPTRPRLPSRQKPVCLSRWRLGCAFVWVGKGALQPEAPALRPHRPPEELGQVPWGGEQHARLHTEDSGAAGHERGVYVPDTCSVPVAIVDALNLTPTRKVGIFLPFSGLRPGEVK